MKMELDNKLVKAFPNLYRDRYSNMQSTAMCWGFECGEGWFQLIWDLSEKLESLIIKFKEENPDCEFLPAAVQVKEKFGGLRFYMTSATDEMYELISEAESKAEQTCERCGAPGTANSDGWITTLCDSCRDSK